MKFHLIIYDSTFVLICLLFFRPDENFPLLNLACGTQQILLSYSQFKKSVIAKPAGLWQSPLTWFLHPAGDCHVASLLAMTDFEIFYKCSVWNGTQAVPYITEQNRRNSFRNSGGAFLHYSTGVRFQDRISPVFSFWVIFTSATLIRDWYLSFLGPDLE